MCVCTSVYLTQLLPFNRHCTKKATKLNFEDYSLCFLFPDYHCTGIWEVLQAIFFCIFHVTSEQNVSPGPEMVYWQWLTANPDQPFKVFCQTGFCGVHIQAAGLLTMGQNVTYLCLVDYRNKNLKWIISGSLHFHHVAPARHIKHQSMWKIVIGCSCGI